MRLFACSLALVFLGCGNTKPTKPAEPQPAPKEIYDKVAPMPREKPAESRKP
jgi:hypothetical protein